MSKSSKIRIRVGVLSIALGLTLFGASAAVLWHYKERGIAAILFVVCVIIVVNGAKLMSTSGPAKSNNATVMSNGTRYTGRIYSYQEDSSLEVNGFCLVNTKVRYIDETGAEREALIKTSFERGSNAFPIGATIDILVQGQQAVWIPGSVRYENS